MLQVTIRFQIFPKSLRTLSKGQSEFCVTNHNDLESSFGGLYDTFKHILSLLLLSSWLRRTRWIYFVSDSIMRFIWVMRFPSSEDYSPQLLFCHYIFFMELDRQFGYSDSRDCEKAAKSIFSAANEITLLWLLDFEDFIQHAFVFHNVSSLSKSLSNVWL